MPRYARLHAPGALVHVIARFVNREFRLAGASERAAFLNRLPRALKRTDWTLCAYALMSNHVHLALLAGADPPWRLLKPLHISMAKWLNQSQGTFGPAFAERATTIVMSPERMAVLVAYLHNNPVRAGLVPDAAACDWTSHRAWRGLDAVPPWLAVDRGLHLAGHDSSEKARLAFARFVASRAGDPRDPELSGSQAQKIRQQVRSATDLPLDVASPAEDRGSAYRYELLSPGPVPPPRWDGDLTEVLDRVASATAVTVAEMCSRSHRPGAVAARRLALVTGAWLLRRDMKEVAAALGIAGPSASRLVRRADDVLPLAGQIASAIRGG